MLSESSLTQRVMFSNPFRGSVPRREIGGDGAQAGGTPGAAGRVGGETIQRVKYFKVMEMFWK